MAQAMTAPDAGALAACPFCGSDTALETVTHKLGYAYVACDGCSTTGPCENSEAEAVSAWNRRTPPADRACDVSQGWLTGDAAIRRSPTAGGGVMETLK